MSEELETVLESSAAKRGLSWYFRPRERIPAGIYLRISSGVGALIIALWLIATYGGLVGSIFLPSPTNIFNAVVEMIRQGTLFQDTLVSIYVIMVGFFVAAIMAIPLGILMGTFSAVEAMFEPPIAFTRYLPITALIPLFILMIGIGEVSRVSIIWFGTFFQLIVMVADVTAGVPKELLETSYTLGISRKRVLTKVLLPATMPGIFDNLRVSLGWAWTYLVVAELLAANRGLGYMILQAMRGLKTPRIYVGVLIIGLLGLISDRLFRYLHNRLFPWSEKAEM